jgi:mycoredoxin
MKLKLFTSPTCPLSNAVEQFVRDYEVPAQIVNIDQAPGAREELAALNGGYPNVPTVILPDGTRLVEPSVRQLRELLAIPPDPWMGRLFGFSR